MLFLRWEKKTGIGSLKLVIVANSGLMSVLIVLSNKKMSDSEMKNFLISNCLYNRIATVSQGACCEIGKFLWYKGA